MKINIDNKSYEVANDSTILEVCKLLNIDIPTLCYDERLTPHSACRMCLVEVEGAKNLVTSCSTRVRDGMRVFTNNEKVRSARREVLDLLLSNHPMECLNCEKSGRCKLQNYAYEYDLVDGTFKGETRKGEIDSSNPFYIYDPEKCILCGLCVRVCDELQCSHAIGFEDRGFDTIVATPFREGLINSECVSCGNCVSVCPVGALVPKSLEKFRHWETKEVRTTCSYCGVGCQIDLKVKDDKVLGAQPAFDGVNQGLLCVKGKFAYKFISHPDRLKTPLIKKNGEFVEASWEEAYRLIRQKATNIKEESGADSFAGLTSARCTNEDNYLFQKLFRAVIGTNNVDHCARL
ncbi:NADPH-Fe(3+) oxidoreductase subunit alpha [Tissierella creatinophila DSM 6911]|uniref:NADPH-Fe(3+) oxidoreductase subunit alpha n=3 Tax=Tissierella creatinophila TaxID=79681 RepID=A0A1U7M8S8_TISCR|nr:NADPH-Fe(3+) oxidoreductase subunit alpha [Tissierella creatinophila DSM 6911]